MVRQDYQKDVRDNKRSSIWLNSNMIHFYDKRSAHHVLTQLQRSRYLEKQPLLHQMRRHYLNQRIPLLTKLLVLPRF